MSGTANFPQPITLNTLPAEGSRVVTVILPWSTALQTDGLTYLARWNFLAQFQSGQFSTVQAVLIDNNTVPYEVLLTEQELGQRIRIPPFAQGMYPVLAGPAPKFQAVLSANKDPSYNAFLPVVGTTTFFFLNVPQRPYETRQLAQGQNYLTVSSFQNFIAPVTLLTALGGNQHFAISGLNLTMMSQGTGYNSAQQVQITLTESGAAFNLWQDTFSAPSGDLQVYSKQFVFPLPLIQRSASASLILACNTYPSGNMLLNYQIIYGIVTIQ